MRIILASESQFRKRGMDLLGLQYEVCPASIDEKAIRDADPAALTKKLSEAKAWKVAERFPDSVIVSGDAVAAKNGKLYEKPRDKAEAKQFLQELSGNTFRFVTAIAVLRSDTRKMLSTAEASEITFRPLLEREIVDYINQYDVLKCAGAFESEGVLKFSERISGCYNLITAMPISRLTLFLREQGVDV
jgi:septum formation protein